VEKWFLLLFVLIYRFCSFHSYRPTKLLVPKNNERMIKKKTEKKEKKEAWDLGQEPSPLRHKPSPLHTRRLKSQHRENSSSTSTIPALSVSCTRTLSKLHPHSQ